MTKHRTDLLALLFGLAFTIAGAIVVVTQATNFDISPQWGAAVGLIVLGVVALVATVARAGTAGAPAAALAVPPAAPAPMPATDFDDPQFDDAAAVGPVSPEDRED